MEAKAAAMSSYSSAHLAHPEALQDAGGVLREGVSQLTWSPALPPPSKSIKMLGISFDKGVSLYLYLS